MQDVNDPKVKEVADFAVSRLNAMSNSVDAFTLSKSKRVWIMPADSTLQLFRRFPFSSSFFFFLAVMEARVQVVAGLNYVVRLELQMHDRLEVHSFKVFVPLNNGEFQLVEHVVEQSGGQ